MNGEFMKKIIVGLLALSSVTAFANPQGCGTLKSVSLTSSNNKELQMISLSWHNENDQHIVLIQNNDPATIAMLSAAKLAKAEVCIEGTGSSTTVTLP
jgi:hypothetical protein